MRCILLLSNYIDIQAERIGNSHMKGALSLRALEFERN
jgi:hypothetical protein